MGSEYKISKRHEVDVVFNLEDLRQLKTFWKIDEESNCYFLGKIKDSEWPELMIWEKEGCVGVTINHAGHAWTEFKEMILRLKKDYPDITITDWDSGENLEEDFFS